MLYCVEVPRVCDEDRHIVGISNDGPVLRLSSSRYAGQAIFDCAYKGVKTQGEEGHTEGATLPYAAEYRYAAHQGSIYLHRRRCLVVQGMYALHKPRTYHIMM